MFLQMKVVISRTVCGAKNIVFSTPEANNEDIIKRAREAGPPKGVLPCKFDYT